MSDLVSIPLEDGGAVLVQRIEADPRGPARATLGRSAVAEASETLEKALGSVRRASQAVLKELGRAAPDEIEVEFGVALSAEAGAFITKAATESHLTVKLTWKRVDSPSALPVGAPPSSRP